MLTKQPLTKPYKVPLLFSYAYLRDMPEHCIDYILKHPRVEMILDSGAFTAFTQKKPITLDEYMNFLQRWGKHLYRYIMLDVLWEPVATAKNLDIMLKKGLKPIPVLTGGDGLERLDELFKVGDVVALGGIKRWASAPALAREYIQGRMEAANGRKVHWLGYANIGQLNLHKPFSCDAATAANMRRFGMMQVYLGNRVMATREKKDLYRNKTQSVLNVIAEAGYKFDDLTHYENWHGWNSVASQVSFYSWVKMGADFFRDNGTRIHLALVSGVVHECFYAIDKFLGINYSASMPKELKSKRQPLIEEEL